MSTKFTTETWRYESGEVTVSGRGCIARIPSPQAGGVFECVANGKLAAAAPDLYAALEDAIGAVRVFHGPEAWDTYWNHSPEAKRWRAALAKARGEA
jgi:hypothetical protein